jgi:ArsR family transcriptional regulator, arsenate/arsenite/antimonite-responsive transcriptional repressor
MVTQMSKRKRKPAARRRACCPTIDTLIEPRFFKAFGDANRVAILCRLAQCRRPCTVGELAACCPVDVSVVSRHLALLREAGVLVAQRRGKQVYYSVNCEIVVNTLRGLAAAIEQCCPPATCQPRENLP